MLFLEGYIRHETSDPVSLCYVDAERITFMQACDCTDDEYLPDGYQVFAFVDSSIARVSLTSLPEEDATPENAYDELKKIRAKLEEYK